MARRNIPVMMREEVIKELEFISKKQGLSRSRLIENIVEEYLAQLPNRKPRTTKEKFIHWLLTGEEV